MSGIEQIVVERERQVAQEGWTPEHDDTHGDASLAWAAVCYAAPERVYREGRNSRGPIFTDPWPWNNSEDKRKRGSNYPNAIPVAGKDRMRMLAKAGALIAAEIDRLERAALDGER